MTALLVLLAVLGARSVFLRLTSRGVNVALSLVPALGIATFLLLHLFLPGGSTLVVALVGLALAWIVVADLVAGRLLSSGLRAPASDDLREHAPENCATGFRAWSVAADLLAGRSSASGSRAPASDDARDHTPEDSETAFRRADTDGNPGAAFNLGELLARRGKLADAEAAFRRADERGHRAGAYALGGLLHARGDLMDAHAAYSRAEERGHPQAASKLGRLLHEQGDLDAAEAAFRRAQQVDDSNGAFGLAAVLKQRGDRSGAAAARRHGEELLRRRERVTPPVTPPFSTPRWDYRTATSRSWTGTGASAPPRPQADAPRSSSGARCPLCVKSDGVGKRIYANEDEAWAAVLGAQARRAAGKAAPDLRRAYLEERCGDWHVTSQD